jgi:hypothetical protein
MQKPKILSSLQGTSENDRAVRRDELVRFDLQKMQAAWRAVKVFARRRWLKFSRPTVMSVF